MSPASRSSSPARPTWRPTPFTSRRATSGGGSRQVGSRKASSTFSRRSPSIRAIRWPTRGWLTPISRWGTDRKSTRLNSSHLGISYSPSFPTRRSSDLAQPRARRAPHGQRGGLRPLPQGALLLEEEVGKWAQERHRVLSAGDRRRSGLFAGLRGVG